MKRVLGVEAKNALLIAAGLMCCCAAYNLYLIPNEIAAGGFTGIGQLVNSAIGVNVGTVSIVLNIPLFLLSMRRLGLSFGIRSLIAMLGLSLTIDYVPLPAATNDLLLATVFGGALAEGVRRSSGDLITKLDTTTGTASITSRTSCSRTCIRGRTSSGRRRSISSSRRSVRRCTAPSPRSAITTSSRVGRC